jgi:uncharacterized protein YhfF
MVDSDGRRVAIVETTAVSIARLGHVDLAHVIDEGEGYDTVADWRTAHVRFWECDEMRELQGDENSTVTDSTELVLERFRLVQVP